MKKQMQFLTLLAVCTMLTGCADSYVLTEPDTGVTNQSIREIRTSLAENYTDGVLHMTKATAETFLTNTTENALYSPVNTYLALGMLAEVTEGEGREEVLALLDASDMDTLRTRADSLWKAGYREDDALTSIFASSLWLNEDMTFHTDALTKLSEIYRSSVYQGKMGEAAYDAAMQEWVNENTGGLLKESAKGIKTDPDMLMTMLSTVYFHAKWAVEFDEEKNTERIFHSPTGDISHTFLHKTDNGGYYYWSDHYGAVNRDLALGGKMWFILPDEGVSLDTVLSEDAMYDMLADPYGWTNAKSMKIHQYIPKFDVSQTMEMRDGLEKLGIVTPFQPDADFTPLTDWKPAFLSTVTQATRVAIDETSVLAASYVEMTYYGAAPPAEEEIEFVLDRPFIFVITGWDKVPLFMGVVYQP